MTEKNLATACVIDWVMNDEPVYKRLKAILDGSDGFRGPRSYGGNIGDRGAYLPLLVGAMADFVAHLLYQDDGSTYRSLYREMNYGGFDSHTPSSIRESFSRTDFDNVNWNKVREELTREDNEV